MPNATVPKRSITSVGTDERARAEDAQRHERRADGATRSARRQPRSTADPATRRIVCGVAPADVRRLDDRVDEQDERARDRQRPGGVIAPRASVAARLSRRSTGDSASAARPRGMLMKKIHSQPRPSTSGPPISQAVGGADAAEHAPDSERLVALGALREGRGDDRERGRGHDRRPDALECAGADQCAGPTRRARRAARRCVKRTRPTMNTRRRPSRSAARPPSRSRPANVSGVGAHAPTAGPAPRSRGRPRSRAARRSRSPRRGSP